MPTYGTDWGWAVSIDERLDGLEADVRRVCSENDRLTEEVGRLKAELAEARALFAVDGDHPCLPLIVIGETFGGGLDARCGIDPQEVAHGERA